jgi:hypothetical protein
VWLRCKKLEQFPAAIDTRDGFSPLFVPWLRFNKRSARYNKETGSKNHEIAELNCGDIKSPDMVAFAQSLKVEPQTRRSYMSHLSGIFAIARPMWGYCLDQP